MKIVWISFFPIESLPDLPPPLRQLPPLHPATWQKVLLDQLKSLPQLDLHVLVVRPSFPRDYTFEWQGVTFHCLKVPKGMRLTTVFWWETILIRKSLRSIHPDLVHAWGSERGAALVASRLPYPYLVTMQGLLEWYAQQAKSNLHHRWEARLEQVALQRASVVTTESSFSVRWLQDHYPHLDVRQAEHAPNWIFHQLERRPETNPLRFIFIGVMSLIKGTDLLLRALDRLKDDLDFRLTIIGLAPPKFVRTMKAATSGSLWERITIRQDLTPQQVAEELARATIMLFPTRADTSPNSVKEAVVAGVPVVASAVGGIVDYVLSGRNGITFRADNLDEFLTAIRNALAHPLFGHGKVDQGILKQMRDYLSPKVMAERFLAAYQSAQKPTRAKW
jgi:glycosyltransferase involved in cell wall biosynthesis